MATRRCWTLRRNGERGSSTERSTPLRSPCPSVGRFHLAANLPTGEIARSRVRRRDAIIRVDIHIGGSRSQGFHQGAHRFARQGSDELRRVEVALSQNAIEATATRPRGPGHAEVTRASESRASPTILFDKRNLLRARARRLGPIVFFPNRGPFSFSITTTARGGP